MGWSRSVKQWNSLISVTLDASHQLRMRIFTCTRTFRFLSSLWVRTSLFLFNLLKFIHIQWVITSLICSVVMYGHKVVIFPLLNNILFYTLVLPVEEITTRTYELLLSMSLQRSSINHDITKGKTSYANYFLTYCYFEFVYFLSSTSDIIFIIARWLQNAFE